MAQVKFTVFGGSGFIGRNLINHLRQTGHEADVPPRGKEQALAQSGHNLGHVIYAIGLTADFRSRPNDTIDAHVVKLIELLKKANFASWTYLSSTRVYAGLPNDTLAQEDCKLTITPSADSLYDLSKLLGEAVLVGSNNPSLRVVRLSNVFGPDQGNTSFLGSVISELRNTGSVEIREDPNSSKDYVSIEDVCKLIPRIALTGRHRTYNLASGQPTSHLEIADCLEQATGGQVTFASRAPRRNFPAIDISRLNNEFEFSPQRLTDKLANLAATRNDEGKQS